MDPVNFNFFIAYKFKRFGTYRTGPYFNEQAVLGRLEGAYSTGRNLVIQATSFLSVTEPTKEGNCALKDKYPTSFRKVHNEI